MIDEDESIPVAARPLAEYNARWSCVADLRGALVGLVPPGPLTVPSAVAVSNRVQAHVR